MRGKSAHVKKEVVVPAPSEFPTASSNKGEFRNMYAKTHWIAICAAVAFIATLTGLACGLSGCAANNPNGPASESVISGDALASGSAGTIPALASLMGFLQSDTGITKPTNIPVQLWKESGSGPYKQTVSMSDGEFAFTDIEPGAYFLKAIASGSLSANAPTLVTVVEGTNQLSEAIVLMDYSDRASIPTADIKGTLVDSISLLPITPAVVTLGGNFGRNVITDELGKFEIKSVPAGNHTITVSKSGFIASATFTFNLEGQAGQPDIATFTFNGNVFSTSIDPTTGNKRVANLGNINVVADIRANGAIAGYVSQRVIDSTGKPTEEKRPVPNWAFQLWVIDRNKVAHPFRDVVTDNRGAFNETDLPGASDNGFEWLAVATGTTIESGYDANGQPTGALVVANPNPPWSGGVASITPIFGLGYKVQEKETTDMNIVLPTGLPPFYQ